MKYDDVALERALDALALEETPADLHGRILFAISQRPEPAFRAWELWLLGAAFAVCTWLILVITRVPLFGGAATLDALRVAGQVITSATQAAFTPTGILWLGLGVLTAFVLQRVAGSRLLRI